MNRTIIALSALLGVQVVLAAGLNLTSGSLAGQPAQTALLSFKAGDVKQLSITNADGKSVTLAEKGGKWVLPGQGDFPADATRIKTLIDDLTSAKEGTPIATTSAAVERFKVADKAFERKIVFGPEKKPLATVYLGTSQGVRQVHVRRGDQSGVRVIDFATYKAPATPDDWVDSTVLNIKPDTVTGLAWGDVKIERKTAATDASAKAPAGDKKTQAKAPAVSWVLDGSTPQTLKAETVQAVTTKLEGLRINGLAPDAPAKDMAAPALDLKVTLDGGKTREYRFWKDKNGDYTVAASELPRQVRISKTVAEDLIKATADKAFQPQPQSPPAKAAEPAAAPAAAVSTPAKTAPATASTTSAPATAATAPTAAASAPASAPAATATTGTATTPAPAAAPTAPTTTATAPSATTAPSTTTATPSTTASAPASGSTNGG